MELPYSIMDGSFYMTCTIFFHVQLGELHHVTSMMDGLEYHQAWSKIHCDSGRKCLVVALSDVLYLHLYQTPFVSNHKLSLCSTTDT